MRLRKPVSAFVLAATLVLASSARFASAQDAVKVAPANHKVLLDNEAVRVYDFMAKPGEKIAMHSHPAHVVYFLSSGKARFGFPDGKTSELEVKPGDVRWADPVTHSLENVGTTEIHAIVVELKHEKEAKKKAK